MGITISTHVLFSKFIFNNILLSIHLSCLRQEDFELIWPVKLFYHSRIDFRYRFTKQIDIKFCCVKQDAIPKSIFNILVKWTKTVLVSYLKYIWYSVCGWFLKVYFIWRFIKIILFNKHIKTRKRLKKQLIFL